MVLNHTLKFFFVLILNLKQKIFDKNVKKINKKFNITFI